MRAISSIKRRKLTQLPPQPASISFPYCFEVRFAGSETNGDVASNHLQKRDRDSSREKILFRRKQHSENQLVARKMRARQVWLRKSKMPKTLGI